ncbi:MAG: hypothetical protein FWC57_04445 [Endomicrobia bacterium]|nr:hypothetical protein [Endomicrobiia bacterium]
MKRIISLVTLTAFLWSVFGSNYAYAQGVSPAAATLKISSFTEPAISGAYGKITDCSLFGGDKVVINIQDLHCNPGVQRNIAGLLSDIEKKYGISGLYAEGAYSDVSTEWINSVSDENMKKGILDALINSGRLTGSEYYSVVSNQPHIIKGIEDKAVHQANIVRMAGILDKQDSYKDVLKSMDLELFLMQSKYFNSENKRFNKMLGKYKSGKTDAGRYYLSLLKYADKINSKTDKNNALLYINLQNYPNLLKYVELSNIAKRINSGRTSSEFTKFVGQLKEKLPYAAYKNLAEKTNNFSNTADLYVYVSQIVSEYGITLDGDYGNLKKFFDYAGKERSFNAVQMVTEEKRLIEKIRLSLSKDPSETEVSFISDFYNYFKGYLSTSIMADDYKYFAAKFPEFEKIWNKYTYKSAMSGIEADFSEINKFYETNFQRDGIFLGKLGLEKNNAANAAATADSSEKALKETLQKSKVIVVVTGGFHSEDLRAELEKEKISHITVTPNVAELGDTQKVYAALIKEQAKAIGLAIAANARHSELVSESAFNPNALALPLGSTGAKVVSFDGKQAVVEFKADNETVETVTLTYKDGKFDFLQDSAENENIKNNKYLTADAVKQALKIFADLSLLPNPASSADIIFELVKEGSLLAVDKGYIQNDSGLIWEIATNDEVITAFENDKEGVLNSVGQLDEALQMMAANKAVSESDIKKHFSNDPFVVAVYKMRAGGYLKGVAAMTKTSTVEKYLKNSRFLRWVDSYFGRAAVVAVAAISPFKYGAVKTESAELTDAINAWINGDDSLINAFADSHTEYTYEQSETLMAQLEDIKNKVKDVPEDQRQKLIDKYHMQVNKKFAKSSLDFHIILRLVPLALAVCFVCFSLADTSKIIPGILFAISMLSPALVALFRADKTEGSEAALAHGEPVELAPDAKKEKIKQEFSAAMEQIDKSSGDDIERLINAAYDMATYENADADMKKDALRAALFLNFLDSFNANNYFDRDGNELYIRAKYLEDMSREYTSSLMKDKVDILIQPALIYAKVYGYDLDYNNKSDKNVLRQIGGFFNEFTVFDFNENREYLRQILKNIQNGNLDNREADNLGILQILQKFYTSEQIDRGIKHGLSNSASAEFFKKLTAAVQNDNTKPPYIFKKLFSFMLPIIVSAGMAYLMMNGHSAEGFGLAAIMPFIRAPYGEAKKSLKEHVQILKDAVEKNSAVNIIEMSRLVESVHFVMLASFDKNKKLLEDTAELLMESNVGGALYPAGSRNMSIDSDERAKSLEELFKKTGKLDKLITKAKLPAATAAVNDRQVRDAAIEQFNRLTVDMYGLYYQDKLNGELNYSGFVRISEKIEMKEAIKDIKEFLKSKFGLEFIGIYRSTASLQFDTKLTLEQIEAVTNFLKDKAAEQNPALQEKPAAPQAVVANPVEAGQEPFVFIDENKPVTETPAPANLDIPFESGYYNDDGKYIKTYPKLKHKIANWIEKQIEKIKKETPEERKEANKKLSIFNIALWIIFGYVAYKTGDLSIYSEDISLWFMVPIISSFLWIARNAIGSPDDSQNLNFANLPENQAIRNMEWLKQKFQVFVNLFKSVKFKDSLNVTALFWASEAQQKAYENLLKADSSKYAARMISFVGEDRILHVSANSGEMYFIYPDGHIRVLETGLFLYRDITVDDSGKITTINRKERASDLTKPIETLNNLAKEYGFFYSGGGEFGGPGFSSYKPEAKDMITKILDITELNKFKEVSWWKDKNDKESESRAGRAMTLAEIEAVINFLKAYKSESEQPAAAEAQKGLWSVSGVQENTGGLSYAKNDQNTLYQYEFSDANGKSLQQGQRIEIGVTEDSSFIKNKNPKEVNFLVTIKYKDGRYDYLSNDEKTLNNLRSNSVGLFFKRISKASTGRVYFNDGKWTGITPRGGEVESIVIDAGIHAQTQLAATLLLMNNDNFNKDTDIRAAGAHFNSFTAQAAEAQPAKASSFGWFKRTALTIVALLAGAQIASAANLDAFDVFEIIQFSIVGILLTAFAFVLPLAYSDVDKKPWQKVIPKSLATSITALLSVGAMFVWNWYIPMVGPEPIFVIFAAMFTVFPLLKWGIKKFVNAFWPLDAKNAKKDDSQKTVKDSAPKSDWKYAATAVFGAGAFGLLLLLNASPILLILGGIFAAILIVASISAIVTGRNKNANSQTLKFADLPEQRAMENIEWLKSALTNLKNFFSGKRENAANANTLVLHNANADSFLSVKTGDVTEIFFTSVLDRAAVEKPKNIGFRVNDKDVWILPEPEKGKVTIYSDANVDAVINEFYDTLGIPLSERIKNQTGKDVPAKKQVPVILIDHNPKRQGNRGSINDKGQLVVSADMFKDLDNAAAEQKLVNLALTRKVEADSESERHFMKVEGDIKEVVKSVAEFNTIDGKSMVITPEALAGLSENKIVDFLTLARNKGVNISIDVSGLKDAKEAKDKNYYLALGFANYIAAANGKLMIYNYLHTEGEEIAVPKGKTMNEIEQDVIARRGKVRNFMYDLSELAKMPDLREGSFSQRIEVFEAFKSMILKFRGENKVLEDGYAEGLGYNWDVSGLKGKFNRSSDFDKAIKAVKEKNYSGIFDALGLAADGAEQLKMDQIQQEYDKVKDANTKISADDIKFEFLKAIVEKLLAQEYMKDNKYEDGFANEGYERLLGKWLLEQAVLGIASKGSADIEKSLPEGTAAQYYRALDSKIAELNDTIANLKDSKDPKKIEERALAINGIIQLILLSEPKAKEMRADKALSFNTEGINAVLVAA